MWNSREDFALTLVIVAVRLQILLVLGVVKEEAEQLSQVVVGQSLEDLSVQMTAIAWKTNANDRYQDYRSPAA